VKGKAEFKKAIEELLLTAYSLGMAEGSRSQVMIYGELYSLADLTEMYKEQNKEAGKLLEELEVQQMDRQDREIREAMG